jgi:hypothetical protein
MPTDMRAPALAAREQSMALGHRSGGWAQTCCFVVGSGRADMVGAGQLNHNVRLRVLAVALSVISSTAIDTVTQLVIDHRPGFSGNLEV